MHRRGALICAFIAGLPALAAAADGQGPTPNMFAPVSTPAYAIREVAFFVLRITGDLFVVVAGLALYTIVRFRRRAGDRPSEPPQVYGSLQIELAWTVVPFLIVIVLFLVIAYQGVRTALTAPDTFGALLAAGITAWLCIQAFINIAVVVALVPITGITLPFVSAGGSSLSISLAAAGILLSISRETVERGTWNDAAADRGRLHGRAHLPGPRRRSLAPKP